MKFHFKNYRIFILTAIIASLILFVLVWGILSFVGDNVQNIKGVEAVETSTITAKDPNSPLLAIVSVQRPAESTYVPSDLVTYVNSDDRQILISKEAAEPLSQLINQAKSEGIELIAFSGFRSFEEQEEIYNTIMETTGKVVTSEDVQGGTSEHQTGLAVDIVTKSTDYLCRQDLALTDEGKWIAENADEFGFIIRYPQGKESVTGTIYEPWHLRYVGVEDAKIITDNNLVLEEYVLTEETNE